MSSLPDSSTENTSPRPWSWEKTGRVIDYDGGVVGVTTTPDHQADIDAKFIVLSANAYDDLVAALEESVAALARFKAMDNVRGSDGPCDCPACRACDSAQAALAKARCES